MNAPSLPAISTRLREIRVAFDATFSQPPAPPPSVASALLLLRAGGELVAVKRDEMTGLVRAENVIPMPSRLPAFIGLAGLRGELYPVWSLAGLLGREPSPAEGDRGWLALAAARPGLPCAFTCEAFERMVFVSPQEIASPNTGRAMVSCDGALVPLIDLVALQTEIHGRKDSTPSRISR